MSRGRKPIPKTKAIEVALSDAAHADLALPMDGHSKRLKHVEELYGDGDPYSLESCIHKARFSGNMAAQALLDQGKQLIRIKEHEPHGEFLHALDQIGIHPRLAQRVMKATVKFSKPSIATLASQLNNRTKLIELMTEDDQVLESLNEGGTLYGLTLDDVDRMSPTELRAKLRDEKQKRKEDQETHERLLVDKNKKIDEYAKRLKDLPAQLRELQIDCARASGECINGVGMFTQIRLSTMDLLNGNARDRNDDEVLGAIGATHLQLLWQVQAWLTEEMQWSEQVFGGSRVQVRMENERGPALTDDEILNLKNAGADEAARVAGPRVAEEIIARRQERAANQKSKLNEEAP